MPSQAPVSAHKRNSYTDEQRTQALADAATQSAKPTATRTRGEPAKRKVAKHYTPSQKAEVVEYARKHGATKASKDFAARASKSRSTRFGG
jgi:hypothetical protein